MPGKDKARSDSQLPTSGSVSMESNGFNRPEMYTAKLVGSIKLYETHVFAVVSKVAAEWPKTVQTPITESICAALKEKKEQTKLVKFTVIEGDEVSLTDGDVLVLPHMLKYRGLKPEDAEQFVLEAVLGTSEKKLNVEPLDGDQLFVCVHGSHDVRCGVCGPPLVEAFRKEIALRNLTTQVWPCTHIGGHKFAGNLIAYTKHPDGSIGGDWYGYVTPKDVSKFLDAFKKGEVIDKLWRGAMNMDGPAQEKAQAARMAKCGSGCFCADANVAKCATLLTKWDYNTKIVVAAVVTASVAIGASLYLRSLRSTN